MPISLTTAYDPGDLDVGNYSKMKVVRVRVDIEMRSILLTCEYGEVVATVWTPGKARRMTHVIDNVDGGTQHFDIAMTALTNDGESLHDAVARIAYQWLIDQSVYTGTID